MIFNKLENVTSFGSMNYIPDLIRFFQSLKTYHVMNYTEDFLNLM